MAIGTRNWGVIRQLTGIAPSPTNWAEAERVVLLFDPGTRWNYGINTDLVGKAVEAVSGQSLDAYLREHVLEPLGMHDTAFLLSEAQQARRARMHARQANSSLLPIDHAAGDALSFFLGGGAALQHGPGLSALPAHDPGRRKPRRRAVAAPGDAWPKCSATISAILR